MSPTRLMDPAKLTPEELSQAPSDELVFWSADSVELIRQLRPERQTAPADQDTSASLPDAANDGPSSGSSSDA